MLDFVKCVFIFHQNISCGFYPYSVNMLYHNAQFPFAEPSLFVGKMHLICLVPCDVKNQLKCTRLESIRSGDEICLLGKGNAI